MSPSRQEKITELLDVLNLYQDRYNRHSAHLNRLNRYYDEAPDGSTRKQEVVKQIDTVSSKKHEVERDLGRVIDELDSLGHEW
jgi:hypothetical protein